MSRLVLFSSKRRSLTKKRRREVSIYFFTVVVYTERGNASSHVKLTCCVGASPLVRQELSRASAVPAGRDSSKEGLFEREGARSGGGGGHDVDSLAVRANVVFVAEWRLKATNGRVAGNPACLDTMRLVLKPILSSSGINYRAPSPALASSRVTNPDRPGQLFAVRYGGGGGGAGLHRRTARCVNRNSVAVQHDPGAVRGSAGTDPASRGGALRCAELFRR